MVIRQDGNTNFYFLVEAYLRTGARRKELLPPSFTWTNIDFFEKTLLFKGIKRTDDR